MANCFEMTGINELVAELRRRGERAVARVESKALKAAGEVMKVDMEQRAPRSPFEKIHLQDNITVSNVKRKDGMKYVLIGPNKKVSFRAHFSEFGTSSQPAKPYIEPAFHAKKTEAMQILADELRKGLRS